MIWPRIALLLLVLVVYGRLAQIGIHLSTLSAHSDLFLAGLAAPASFPRGRTRRVSGGGSAVTGIAASYARYSSDLQDASSIDQQRRKCRDRADQNDHTILPELEFADEAVSGTKRDRAGLNAMLDAARTGRFGTLYLDSLSRLAREFVITMPMLKELVYVHKIRVISVGEGIDSLHQNWELMAIFQGWMAEEYLKALRAAVLRGQEETVLNDWSVGDWCLGYASEPIPGSEAGRTRRTRSGSGASFSGSWRRSSRWIGSPAS